MADAAPRDRARGLSIHWRGHAFLFGATPAPTWDASAGLRLLLIFIALEWIVGPRLSLLNWIHVPQPPIWVRVPLLLCIALLLVRFAAGLALVRLGLRRWREWSGTEKSYFLQLVVIANVVFSILFANRLREIFAEPSAPTRLLTMFLPYVIWGFYQEVIYRGILQSELVRRWGPALGIVAANLLFTFGPLHFYHFKDTMPAWPMFAGIFAIGLFFGVLFWRSGNLWIVAIAHGIGDAYIEGLNRR